MRNPQVSIRRKLLLSVTAPVVFFLFLEGILRLCGFGHPSSFTIRKTFNEKEYHIPNPQFTARFFPRQTPRLPVPFAVPVKKPANSLRVLVLGASAAQGDPKPEFGFSRMLDRMLSGQFPEKSIEIHNLGITAINSHVVREIAEDCRNLEADYWIVYLGNNEVIGPFGPANPGLPSIGLIRKARISLAKSRTGQLLQNILASNKEQQLQWQGMEEFLKPITWDSPELNKVHKNFRANLEDIIESGNQAGAKILLCTVAVNLLSCSPLNPDGEAGEKWDAGEPATARDLDTYRFRADSRINQIIPEVAASGDIILVKAAEGFESLEPNSAEPLFHDHVHFTLAGNRTLAGILLKTIMEREKIDFKPPTINPTLGFTKFDRQSILKIMRGRLNRAPFLKQAKNGLSPQKLDAVIKELAPRSPEDLQSIANQYLVAIEAHPNDPVIRLNYATFLLSHNQAEIAKAHCREAITLSPWNPSPHYTLGLALAGTNSPTSARKHLETALTLHPTHHLSHALLGNLLAINEPAKALEHLQTSLRIEPDDARTLLTLANLRLTSTETDLRDPVEAFDLALRACSVSDYANPAAVGMLIEAARQSGRKTEARVTIETAIQKVDDPSQKAALQQALEGF